MFFTNTPMVKEWSWNSESSFVGKKNKSSSAPTETSSPVQAVLRRDSNGSLLLQNLELLDKMSRWEMVRCPNGTYKREFIYEGFRPGDVSPSRFYVVTGLADDVLWMYKDLYSKRQLLERINYVLDCYQPDEYSSLVSKLLLQCPHARKKFRFRFEDVYSLSLLLTDQQQKK